MVELLRGRGTVAPDEPGIDAMGITQLLYQDTPRESLGKAEQNVTKILLKLAADGLAAEVTAAAAAVGNIGGATLPLEDDTASGASVNDGRAEPTVGAEDTRKLWVWAGGDGAESPAQQVSKNGVAGGMRGLGERVRLRHQRAQRRATARGRRPNSHPSAAVVVLGEGGCGWLSEPPCTDPGSVALEARI